MNTVEALRRFFTWSGRWTPLTIAAVAILFLIPSLFAGFIVDDHFFRAIFKGFPGVEGVPISAVDTFIFGDGVPEHNRARINEGILPWWTPPDWHVGFWRPLSSWSHWLDFQVYGDRPLPMHLESILLYVLIGLVLYRLYARTIHPAWVAALAALVYMIDDAHGWPVTWISNRNTVLATLFAVLTVYFHDRWRRDGARWGLPLALISLTLGLLSGEAAIAVGGYLAAHALYMDTGSITRRSMRLLPYLVLVVVWRLVYLQLGYGVDKVAIYTDPFGHPDRFAIDVVRYVPPLLFSQFFQLDPGVSWTFLGSAERVLYWIVACFLLALVTRCLWPILRQDKAARFWAVGMIISILPSCATLPQARLLMIPGMGAMALVAILLYRWYEGIDRRRLTTVVAYTFVILHIILAPLLLLITGAAMRSVEHAIRESNINLDTIENLPSRHLVVLNTVADLSSVSLTVMRAAERAPMPDRYSALYAGVSEVEVERTDQYSLVLRPEGGFLPRPWSQIFVDPRDLELKPGDTIDLEGLTIEVIDVLPDNRPAMVKFTFDRPLDDPTFAFVSWERGGYKVMNLPPPGTTFTIPQNSLARLSRSVFTP